MDHWVKVLHQAYPGLAPACSPPSSHRWWKTLSSQFCGRWRGLGRWGWAYGGGGSGCRRRNSISCSSRGGWCYAYRSGTRVRSGIVLVVRGVCSSRYRGGWVCTGSSSSLPPRCSTYTLTLCSSPACIPRSSHTSPPPLLCRPAHGCFGI